MSAVGVISRAHSTVPVGYTVSSPQTEQSSTTNDWRRKRLESITLRSFRMMSLWRVAFHVLATLKLTTTFCYSSPTVVRIKISQNHVFLRFPPLCISITGRLSNTGILSLRSPQILLSIWSVVHQTLSASSRQVTITSVG